jgi:hypothetical protein
MFNKGEIKFPGTRGPLSSLVYEWIGIRPWREEDER